MLRRLCALTLMMSAAGPIAQAEAVDRRVDAGPALAGDTVLWGEENQDGSLAIVGQAPGRRASPVLTLPRPQGAGAVQGFTGLPGSLTASGTRIAYGLDQSSVRCQGEDSCGSTSKARTFSSTRGAAFGEPFPGCVHSVLSTDVDADATAVAQSYGSCIAGGPPTASVWVQEGDAAPRAIATVVDPGVLLGSVHLAGPYVAWTQGNGGSQQTRLTVADRATGAVLAELTPNDFGAAGTFRSFDLDADGNVAAVLTGARRSSAVVLNLADRRPRVLSRQAGYTAIALAGGRVAYTTVRSYWTDRLVLSDVRGTGRRTLMRFRRDDLQPTIGAGIALTADRIAWSFIRSRTGDASQPGRGGIRTVALP